ncbi:ABC superfamily ATP binding cassette transporter, membrane domain protein [[Clostridium] sordellii ATCC 9714]|nr:ABC superfamily ATP binding cassette transporter, membrane domain protein [[Clostridium] sordellii ATCC 9714] [Paeniclostridium sordellii ATCC 9714]
MKSLKIIGRKNEYIYSIITFLILVIIWQLYVDIKEVPQYILPSPIDIIQIFFDDYQNLISNSFVTLLNL